MRLKFLSKIKRVFFFILIINIIFIYFLIHITLFSVLLLNWKSIRVFWQEWLWHYSLILFVLLKDFTPWLSIQNRRAWNILELSFSWSKTSLGVIDGSTPCSWMLLLLSIPLVPLTLLRLIFDCELATWKLIIITNINVSINVVFLWL